MGEIERAKASLERTGSEAAVAVLKRFRIDSDKALKKLRANGTDPKLIKSAEAAYQHVERILGDLVLKLADAATKKAN